MIRDQFWQAVQIIAMCAAVAIALIWVCSCGRPNRQEILHEVIAALNEGKFTCEWEVEAPDNIRRGEKIKVKATPTKCEEKK